MRFAALLVMLALPVAAQTPTEAASAAAARLEAAQMRMADAQGARDRVGALTETVQAYEDGLSAIRDSLRQVSVLEAETQAALAQNRAETVALIATLQAISQTPVPVQLTHPQGPVGSLRAGMMVAELTPDLQTRAATLGSQVNQLRDLRQKQQDAIATLTKGLQSAQTARAALGLAISQRTELPMRFRDDPIKTALLLASTDTLEDFANGLVANAPVVQTGIKASGDLPLPVAGTVAQVADRPGIMIRAAPRALVTTPVPATVLFRGPLLDYGNVIILEPTTDVLFVIAGLAEVFGEPGEILAAGAPLGFLTGAQSGVDGILNQNSGNDTDDGLQPLYLEVRDGQGPIDPGGWFALQ